MVTMNSMSRRIVLRSSGALLLASREGDVAVADTRRGITARLNRNENPFGPSQQAREALAKLGDRVWKYAYDEVAAFRDLIATHNGVRPENIIVSEGSGEILKLCAMIYGESGKQVVAAQPTFTMLPRYAARRGAAVTWVGIDKNFGLDFAAMRENITGATSLVYICNPNNPTGVLTDSDTLRTFIDAVSGNALIVVDEAYIDFAAEPEKSTMIDRVKAGRNVLITRSFSKLYGLAGLRIGYGMARSDIIQRLESLRISIPNQAGVAAASASLGDGQFRNEARRKIASGVAFCRHLFEELGLRCAPTQANFIMFDTCAGNGEFMEFAQQRDVLVAPVDVPFSSWARVSIGRPEDMDRFAQILREFLRKS